MSCEDTSENGRDLPSPRGHFANSRNSERPIFVVGCQRSGTTALAVMLDRHSRIAMMPETQFFNIFVPRDRARGGPMTHEALVERALSDVFIREAHLDASAVLEFFKPRPATYENLFRALMEGYAAKHDRPRVAEKSCDHLFHTREILELYPEAKILCIVRDGRDVVRSLRKVPWGGPKPWMVYCRYWNLFSVEVQRTQRRLPRERFMVVRYEDLMRQPEQTLRRVCEFIGEPFEPSQVSGGVSTDVVPAYEQQWKGKATQAPDASRVAAWRKADPIEIAKWNHYMGPRLRELDYDDVQVTGVSVARRAWWSLCNVLCWPGVYPITLRANRVARFLLRRSKKSTFGDGPADAETDETGAPATGSNGSAAAPDRTGPGGPADHASKEMGENRSTSISP